jgi:hypothetical protein
MRVHGDATNARHQSAIVPRTDPRADARSVTFRACVELAGWSESVGNQLHPQGDVISWFTYDGEGKPWWLFAELHRAGLGIYRTRLRC